MIKVRVVNYFNEREEAEHAQTLEESTGANIATKVADDPTMVASFNPNDYEVAEEDITRVLSEAGNGRYSHIRLLDRNAARDSLARIAMITQRRKERADPNSEFLTEVQENEYELRNYWVEEGGVRDEYEEMMIQFG